MTCGVEDNKLEPTLAKLRSTYEPTMITSSNNNAELFMYDLCQT